MKKISNKNFFTRDTISVAQNLIGKWIVTNINGVERIGQICEAEAYLGVTDSACHTFGGKRTSRTEPMWQDGGTIYIYLCYGLHNLLNIVTCSKGEPEAVLVRALVGYNGPAKTTKFLNIDKTLNGSSIINNDRIAIYDDGKSYKFIAKPRVGIEYANDKDKNAPLRYVLL